MPALAEAQYVQRFTATTNGAITFAGNTLGLDGAENQNGPGTVGAIHTFVTTDTSLQDGTFPPGTTSDWRLNRSQAILRLPVGARVLRAELIWGGSFADASGENVSASLNNPISFTTPAGTFDVTPDPATANRSGTPLGDGTCLRCYYVRTADVTALVIGPGGYAAGRVPATQGTTDNSAPAAGWTLAVVYEDFTQPIRLLNLLLGLEPAGGATAQVAGFCASQQGNANVAAHLAVTAMEGDAGMAGDQLLFGGRVPLKNGDQVQGPRNPKNNFFAGQIVRDDGSLATGGTFGDRNHTPGAPVAGARQGWDITNIDVSGALKKQDATAFAQGTTSGGDLFWITALGFQIDTAAPSFSSAGTKSVDKSTAAVGDVLTYAIRIDNSTGTVDASNVIFFDTPPAGTSFVGNSLTVDGVVRAGADPVAGVPLGTVAVGTTVTITLQVQIDSIVAGPNASLISNRARWTFDFSSCSGPSIQQGSIETNTATTLVAAADLSISGSFPSAPAKPGAQVTYQLVVRNSGPSAVNGAVVADAGTTPALAGINWTCVPINGSATCGQAGGSGPPNSTVSLPAGGAATFTIAGTLPANVPPGTITNTATIAAPATATDFNLSNNTTAASAAIAPQADLRVTKAGPASTQRGDNVTYTVTVTNDGPSDAQNVVVTDPTPAGLTLVTPLAGPCAAAPGCTISAASSQTLSVTYAVPSAYSGPDPIVNTATASAGTPDPRPASNVARATTSLLAPVADVSITKTNGVSQVTAGLTTTYTITVTNAGPASAPGSRVVDQFDPAMFASVQWQCIASGTSSCAASGTQSGDIDTLIDVSPGAGNAVVITAQALVRSNARGIVENTATVSVAAGVTDPTEPDDVSTDTDTVVAVADTSIVKSGPAQIVAGTTADYTITVANAGPSSVRDFAFVEAPQDGGALFAGPFRPELIESIQAPPDSTCVNQTVQQVARTFVAPVCTIPVLAPGASRIFTVRLSIPPDYRPQSPGTPAITNAALLLSSDAQDPTPLDNRGVITSTLSFQADVTVTKLGLPAVIAGAVGSYFIDVTNRGPSTATNVVVSDPFPAGLTLAGGSGPCAAGFPCTIPLLEPGEDSTTRIDLQVPFDYSGPPTFVNTASVTATESDPVASNNSSSVSTLVIPDRADLAVTLSGSSVVAPGGVIEYVATVTNLGPGTALNVTSSDVIPAVGVITGGTVPPPPTTCTVPPPGTANLVSCLTPVLAPGASEAFSFTVQMSSNLVPGTVITNLAVVSSPTPDFTSQNGRTELITLVAAPTDADVSVKQTDSPDPVISGNNVTYTITVRNAGPANATNVVLTDVLPPEFTLVSAVPSQGTCAGATCTLGTLTASATATVTLVAATSTVGLFVNTASVTAAETDPVPANNASSEPTTVADADQADLVVTKSSPSLLEPGETAFSRITVTNRGPADAKHIQLLDSLPADFPFAGNSGDCFTPFPCTFDLLRPGDTVVIQTAFIVAAGVATPTTEVNTASVTSVTPDPDVNNNGAAVSTEIQPATATDLAVVKRDSRDPVIAGTNFSYALSVANRGPATSPAVTLTDVLPPGVSAISATATQGSCTGTATITCQLGEMLRGRRIEIGILASAPQTVPVPNRMINSASVTTGGPPDFDLSDNTATEPTTVVPPIADLAIVKTMTTPAIPGLSASYTIVVTNNGPSAVSGASVVDAFPAAFGAVGWTCVADSGSACGAASGGGNIATTVNLQAGHSATITAAGTIASSTLGVLVNTASVVAPSEVTDPSTLNNIATSAVTVTPVADLQISKSGPAQATPGSTITYAITVTDAGPSDAANVTLSDPTPTGLTFVSASGACSGGFPCSLGTIVAGAAPVTITATFAVPAGYTSPDPIVNTATVSSTTADPATGNNNAIATTAIAAPVTDLGITKTNGVTTVVPGSAVTYTITVTNAGPSNAVGARVIDTLPAALTGATWTCTGAGGGACSMPAGSGNINATVDVPVGGAVTFRVTATVAADAVGVLVNTATVTPGPGASDPSSANNTDSDQLTPQADVVITEIGPASIVPGNAVVYTITVTNRGPSNAAAVIVSDPTPADLTFVSNAGDCATAFPCALGAVPAGAARTITATFTVPANYAGPIPIVNTATVSSATPDPDGSNNQATVETTLNHDADVEVTKSVAPPSVQVGHTVTFTVTAHNRGPNPATGIQVTDLLPAGLQFVSAAATAGTYDPATGQWSVGSLAFGASAQLVIAATVTSRGAITNLALKTGQNEPDPDTGNDSAAAAINAAPTADLALAKRVDRSNALTGERVTFTVIASNRGPNAATGVTVADALPAGLSLVSATASQGVYDATTGIWTVGGVNASAQATLMLVATVTQPGALVNNAVVASLDQIDPNPLNNSSAASVNAATSADLRVTKAVSNTAPAVGEPLTYTIAVTNLGPSATTSAAILDALPAGATFVSATPSQGTFDATTGVWTLGAMPVAANETLSITAIIKASSADNTATRQSSAPADPNPSNDSGTAAATASLVADLEIAKTPSPAAVVAGQPLSWQILVTNHGPSDAAGVTVTDLFAPAFTGTVWSCTASIGSTCATPSGTGSIATTVDLISGGHATFVASGTVSPAAAGSLVNAAGVAVPAATTDPDPTNNNATATVTLTTVADVTVTATGPVSVDPGSSAVYAITIANGGPSSTGTVTLSVPTPIGLVLTGVTGGCVSVPCTLSGLAPAETGVVTVSFTVPANYAGPDPITFTAAATSAFDPNPFNDAVTIATAVRFAADLAIGKTGTASVIPGSSVAYTIAVSNAGPSAAQNVAVDDPTPAGLTFVSTSGDCLTTFPCALGTLPAGATRTITAIFDVPLGYIAPSPIVNTATIVSTTPDPMLANNRASAPTLVETGADVEVTKSAPPNAVVGRTVTMTITAVNHGPQAATGVAITDQLPAGMEFVSATPAQGSYDSQSGVWTVGALAAGATAQLAITATATEAGSLTNLALKTAQNEPDPITANDSGAVVLNVAAAADLAVSKVVDRVSAVVGGTVTFTVTATNRGPSPATGVTIADLLPAGFALSSVTPAQGSYDAATGLWAIGSLAVGAAPTMTIAGTVTAPGVLVNNASVASQAEIDPDPLNNSDAASVNAAATADLHVSLEVSNPSPPLGSPVTFTISVTNLGPSPAILATVRDLLPAGLTFVSATASQGTYEVATGDWTLGVIPVTRSETLAITARLDQPRSVTNVAALQRSAPADPNPANDAMSVVLTPSVIADLAVTVTPGATTVDPGATLVWTIVVSNAGPADASGATVTSTFSAAFTGASWTCAATPGSACAAANGVGSISTTVTLVHGGSATFTVTGLVGASATGTLVNTTSIAAPPTVVDPVPANNTATSSVTVASPPSPPNPPEPIPPSPPVPGPVPPLPPIPPRPVPPNPPEPSPPIPPQPIPPTPEPMPPIPPPSGGSCVPGTGRLDSGDLLSPNGSIASQNGRYVFLYQLDGNVVVYDQGVALWDSETIGSTLGLLQMQRDGNLVLYDGSGAAVWASGTAGYGGASLFMQDDGNAVIYANGVPVWATNTGRGAPTAGCPSSPLTLLPGESLVSADGRFYLQYQMDGNLVVYESGVGPIWASGTAGSSPGRLVMQGDGNLVLYDAASRVVAATNTGGHPGARLVMQDDGNLVIYAANGDAVWSTHTVRR
ncbi:MAG TPA: hypothetical protein VKE96_11940 [Vicinamibacterales bacterium]|nr:hypothetical protein [Vicinamibacterales bacterium]